MKTIDLHIHSYYSDGEESPVTLLNAAIDKNFGIFSITDHNYISPEQNRLKKLAEKQGVLFIQGIEVSCVDKRTNESLHILGYSNSFNFEKINKKLLTTIEGYNNRAKKIIKKLNHKYTTGFDYQKIKNEIPSAYVSINYLAHRLFNHLNGGITPKELISEVFIKEDNSWMLDVREAIKIIEEANGVAILAHPGNLVGNNQFDKFVKKLIKFGLKGIEVYAPKHDTHTINVLGEIAEKFNLILTAGSDWHGTHTSQKEKGILVSDEIYNKLSAMFGYKKLQPIISHRLMRNFQRINH
jgi:predicted metal-dependent phosphoesterase TrpH